MKINKYSWHARVARFWSGTLFGEGFMGDLPPMSLCEYVWRVFFGVLGLPLVPLLYIFIGIVFVVLVVLFVIFRPIVWVIEHFPQSWEPAFPSIVWAWLVAKKEKMCPLIEWDDK